MIRNDAKELLGMVECKASEIDLFIFDQIKTDNNYIHVEKPKLVLTDGDIYKAYANYRTIGTVENIQVFDDEDIYAICLLRETFNKHDIDYNTNDYDTCIRLLDEATRFDWSV